MNSNKKILIVFTAFFIWLGAIAQQNEYIFTPAATQQTPGKSHYYSWISHTNEGPSMSQVLAEIEFFQWLKEEYGMQLDIFAIDAGMFDGKKFTSHFNDSWFKQNYPDGLEPMKAPLKKLGAGLGIWGGPDGFGNSEQEKKERVDMFLRLAKDYNLVLYKCDAVCGTLREEKEETFVDLWKKLRKINPHLYFLNERLELEKGESVSTTHLFESRETYIDVMMKNGVTAPHHRAEPLSRLNFPDNNRLMEDHGVCLSSCLDYWEDDLVIQAFGRNSVLSPQIYANPWLLSDDEFPHLARIFNLHREYRDLLVNAISLPEDKYGFQAISRGSEQTRLLVLRNLSWDFEERTFSIGEEIGLANQGSYEVRTFHPSEKIIGKFKAGENVSVTVPPFRAVLIGVFKTAPDLGINGINYEVQKNVPGKPIEIDLLGFPGEDCMVSIQNPERFSEAVLDGADVKKMLSGKQLKIQFLGEKMEHSYHRKLITLASEELPEDARCYYEATCFAASNDALEVQSLERSGESAFEAVNKARDEFFNQPVFINRGAWDKYLFDGDLNTTFYPTQRRTWARPDQIATIVNKGSLRLDLGKEYLLDSILLITDSYYGLQPCKKAEGNDFYYSVDLKKWKQGVYLSSLKSNISIPKGEKVRYLYLPLAPYKLVEVEGYVNGEKLDCNNWKANNLFSDFNKIKFTKSWSGKSRITEITPDSYLAVAINGIHGQEGAYAAMKVDGKYYGAYDRAPSFPSNVWENYVLSTDRNYTYYLPLLPEFEGKELEIVVLGGDQCEELNIEVWQTAYPVPYQKKRLVMSKKDVQ